MCNRVSLQDVVSTLKLDWKPSGSAISIPALSRDCIHLWALDLAKETIESIASNTTDEDKRRASRIGDDRKKHLYLGGRAGIRSLLSLYTGISPSDIRFSYGNRGKPELANEVDGAIPTFNYTLSRDKVLYVVSQERRLGIDMEVFPRTINASLMARRKLTETERRNWENLPYELGNDSMLCCWTRKEAYGKAIGVGIRFELGRVNLFDHLHLSHWRTELVGLFKYTDRESMPRLLEGVQLGLPFEAAASLMYDINNGRNDRPKILPMTLNL